MVKESHVKSYGASILYRPALLMMMIKMFVCVEVLWPSQPSGVMLSMVSLPNHTLLGRLSPLSG